MAEITFAGGTEKNCQVVLGEVRRHFFLLCYSPLHGDDRLVAPCLVGTDYKINFVCLSVKISVENLMLYTLSYTYDNVFLREPIVALNLEA